MVKDSGRVVQGGVQGEHHVCLWGEGGLACLQGGARGYCGRLRKGVACTLQHQLHCTWCNM